MNDIQLHAKLMIKKMSVRCYCSTITIFLTIAISIMNLTPSSAQASANKRSKIVIDNSIKNQQIEMKNSISIISDFFNEYSPEKIYIKATSNNNSSFDTKLGNTIYISEKHSKYKYQFIHTVVNETSHLAMYKMTNGNSATNKFKFLDEGLAEVLSARSINNLDYKHFAIKESFRQLKQGNLSIKKIQNWKLYFGLWQKNIKPVVKKQKQNFNAYHIAASFIYFMIDNFSEKKLKTFIKNIAITNNLNDSLKTIINANIELTEKMWIQYIKNVNLKIKCDTSFTLRPANNSLNISKNIKEISIKFKTKMKRAHNIFSNCSTGLCYKTAYWKDNKTLIISSSKMLISGHHYHIKIGDSKHGHLITSNGCELPIINWKFKVE